MRILPATREQLTRHMTGAVLALLIAILALASPTPAVAEGQPRIAEQYGIVSLLLNVVRVGPAPSCLIAAPGPARPPRLQRIGDPPCGNAPADAAG